MSVAAPARPSEPLQACRAEPPGEERFAARPRGRVWPRTALSAQEAEEVLHSVPFLGADRAQERVIGIRLLLQWLGAQPGRTWQERWEASGADAAGRHWRQVPSAWLAERGHVTWRRDTVIETVPMAIGADLLRPSVSWLVDGGGARGGLLVRHLAAVRDPDGFTRLRQLCRGEASILTALASQSAYRCALILAAKGGQLADVVFGDALELFDAEDRARAKPGVGRSAYCRIMSELGIFEAQASALIRRRRTGGQHTPQELIDRYGIVHAAVRDLLVEYLRERQPALDYTSLESLAYFLGKLFWADIETHHPGIEDLRLPREVADAWKQRLRTVSKSSTTAGGVSTKVTVPRINYRECLTPVRAFYLDLAHWAVEDPGRWGPWVAPCPVGEEEVDRRKDKQHRKSRIDARTRERLPVLPALARGVAEHRIAAEAILRAAAEAGPGQTLILEQTTVVRTASARGTPDTVWVADPATGQRRNLSREEDHAFWSWAIVEVLRATGVRIEELLEISHHSLVQYRLPTSGEVIPLLQILPSKTDAERMLVVSPNLAEVLSAIISRNRRSSGAVPLVAAYDGGERTWSAPEPLLFQRRIGTEDRAIAPTTVRKLLSTALTRTGLASSVTGEPLHYTPHDFRRMFITDAILGGLPPHIAQVIAGHRDSNVTLGYKAVYPEETITAHLAFLARRRSLRPSQEYRTPTDAEWEEFLGHFERRKVSTGTCARAFATPCIHEHACIRCSMLWPDPAQRDRLIEIRNNLLARIAEAEREGWLGEIEGLQISLAGANEKLTQIDQRNPPRPVTNLGIPARRNHPPRP